MEFSVKSMPFVLIGIEITIGAVLFPLQNWNGLSIGGFTVSILKA